MRENAHLFVCCHRQSDPSCTYMETLGCGVPIIGYTNSAFSGIMHADVGWLVKKNEPDLLAEQIAGLAIHRDTISIKSKNAVALASTHSFEMTFLRRIQQLQTIADKARS